MRQALRRFFAYATDNGLSAALSFAITILAARSASAEEFGTFALALAIAALQMQVGLAGVPGILYGRAASRPRTANALHWSAVRANLIFGGAIYLLTLAILTPFSPPLLTTLYALSGLRVVGGFGDGIRRIYQARSEPESFVPVRVIVSFVAFTATIAAFVMNGGLWCYAAIWGGEWLGFSTLLFALAVRRGTCPLTKSFRVKKLLSRASPLLVQTLCVTIYLRFDQVYIGWRFGPDELALYAVAARVTEAVTLLYGLISLVVSPRMIREWLEGGLSRLSRIILVVMAAGSVSASVLCIWVGSDLLVILFGVNFGGGGHLLSIYLLSTCFAVYGMIGSSICAARGTTAPNMLSGVFGAASNIVLTAMLCEIVGPAGAAVATVTSYAIAAYILWYGAANRWKGAAFRFRRIFN